MQKTEFIIKPGFFEKKRFGAKQPGLDVTRTIFDVLKSQSLVATTDCCTYYPTFPVLIVADHTTPTAAEIAKVPVGGIFIAKESAAAEDWILWMKDSSTSAFDFGSNA